MVLCGGVREKKCSSNRVLTIADQRKIIPRSQQATNKKAKKEVKKSNSTNKKAKKEVKKSNFVYVAN